MILYHYIVELDASERAVCTTSGILKHENRKYLDINGKLAKTYGEQKDAPAKAHLFGWPQF